MKFLRGQHPALGNEEEELYLPRLVFVREMPGLSFCCATPMFTPSFLFLTPEQTPLQWRSPPLLLGSI